MAYIGLLLNITVGVSAIVCLESGGLCCFKGKVVNHVNPAVLLQVDLETILNFYVKKT